MRNCFSILAGLTLGMASVVSAQQTLTVGPSGNYPDINSALAVAMAGDTVLVERGNYGTLNLRKGVNVVAEVGTTVSFFEINRVPLGEVARVYGLEHVQTAVGARILNSLGMVIVERCILETAAGSGDNRVWNNAAVFFEDCELSPDVQFSSVSFEGCTMNGLSDFFGGTPGLIAGNSTVVISNCRVSGGDGSAFGSPAPAVSLTGSDLTVSTRQGGSQLVAGRVGTPAAVAAVDGTGTVLTHPGATLIGNGGSPAIVGPTVTSEALLSAARATPAMLGGLLTVTASGPPTVRYAFALGLPNPPQALPNLTGDVWLRSLAITDSGVTDPSGSAQTVISIPNLPAIRGFALGHQVVTFTATKVVLSNAAISVLR